MTFTKTNWQDRIIERPNTYSVEDNIDGSITLTPVTGVVTQTGTPLSANNLNTMEDRITSSLEEKANITYVNTQVQSMNSQVQGFYSTSSALTTAFPSGNSNNYVVTGDSNKIYRWNGTTWVSTGFTWSNAVLADNSVKGQMIDKSSSILLMQASKNLIDLNAVTTGYYINYTNGVLTANASFSASDFIPVISGKSYTFSRYTGGSLGQIAFYDSNKNYVSGISNSGVNTQVTFTAPVNGYVRLSLAVATLNSFQLEQSPVMTNYESFKYIVNKSNLGEKTISKDKLSFDTVEKKVGKNLLNINNLTNGFSISYLTGAFVINATYSVTDFIELEHDTDYTYSADGVTLEQFALYDENHAFVSGNIAGSNPISFTTGSTVKYGRFTVKTANINSKLQLEKGTTATSYEGYSTKIPATEIEGTNTIIIKTVKLDGTGDYTSLREALDSINDASSIKQYVIEIHEGIYDIISYYTTEEIASPDFEGMEINNYIHLKGIGDKNKIILKGELPDGYDPVVISNVSTIATFGNVNLENLTVTAKNLRYAVHDDYNYPNAIRHVKDCRFVKYSGGYQQAYGGGTKSGMKFIFENCYFYTGGAYLPFSFHNSAGASNPSSIKLINCEFENEGGVTSIRFGSLGSGQDDSLEIIGCKILGSGNILFFEEVDGVGIDWKLTGYANDIVPVKVTKTNPNQFTYNFIGETRKVRNGTGATITKGTPVRLLGSNNGVGAMSGSDAFELFYGIACEDITTGNKGIIRLSGYIQITDTSLTGLVLGDKIGIVSGQLAKVTIGDYIGVVTLTEFIELK